MSHTGTPHVSFIINTDLPSARDVIDRLGGIEPDDSWSKGKRRRRGRTYVTPYTGVEFLSPITPEMSTDVVAQTHALLNRLEPIRNQLLDLKLHCETQGTELEFHITYFEFVPLATVAWLELGIDDLRRIASFGATFDCEYVSYGDAVDPNMKWREDPDRGFFYEDNWRSNHGLPALEDEMDN